MPSLTEPVDPFALPPDPGRAGTLDDLVERLRLLKVWAGNPSYETITSRVDAAWRGGGRAPGGGGGPAPGRACRPDHRGGLLPPGPAPGQRRPRGCRGGGATSRCRLCGAVAAGAA